MSLSITGSGDGLRVIDVQNLTVKDTFFAGKQIDVGIQVVVDPAVASHISIVGNSIDGFSNGVVVERSGGTVSNAASGYTIANNDLVNISGVGISVLGGTTGTTIAITGNSVSGSLDTSGNRSATGEGIIIDSSTTGDTLGGVTVSNNDVAHFGRDGIKIDPVFGTTVIGNNVFDVGDNGIEVGPASGSVTIRNNTVNGTGLNAIFVHDITGALTDTISIARNTIGNDNSWGTIGGGGIVGQDNTGFAGIIQVVSNRIGVDAGTGATPSSIAGSGIDLSGSGGQVSVVSNSIANTGIFGVRVNGAGAVSISSNTISATPGGVALLGTDGASVISRNSISVDNSTSATGITLGNTGSQVQILFNDIIGASTSNGIGIDTANGNFLIQNNKVNNFHTGLHVAAGTNVLTPAVISGTIAGSSLFNNDFSGNSIGVDHEGTGIIQASGNYWGFASDSAAFQAYFAHNAALGVGTGMIDVTPFLTLGTDGNGAAVGFVGDFHHLFVTAQGMQVDPNTDPGVTITGWASDRRVQEAVDLLPSGAGSLIEIGTGTFLDNVVIDRADVRGLTSTGQGSGMTIIDGLDNTPAVMSLIALNTSVASPFTLSHLDLTGTSGATADGFVTSNVSHIVIDDVFARNLGGSGFNFVGGSDITLRDGVQVSTVGNDGIGLTNVKDVTITQTTIGNVVRDGIGVTDSSSVSIGGTVAINMAGTGRDAIRVQSNTVATSASIGDVAIQNPGANGVNIISSATRSATVTFTGGTSISNNIHNVAFNAVRVDGARASFTLPTPDGTVDLALNIDTTSTPIQNYFLLTNGAMGGTVTLGYDVEFLGLSGALSTFQTPFVMGQPITANQLSSDQIAALFQIEDHMVHAVDDPSLGLIRLIPDALFPTALGGLNGVQNAINLSSNVATAQDTVFLQAGDYADPSNLVPNGLVIDRNIVLSGAKAGVVATDPTRNPTDITTETILDFNSATSPSNGIRITDPSGGPGVVIDGVVVQVGANQGFGIRIDASAERSDITIENSFIRGSNGNNATGDGIQTAGGSSAVTGLNITGNVIEYFDGDGIHLNGIVGLTLQDNRIGNANAGSIGGRGIDINGVTFDTSLSGNTIVRAGLDGIRVQNVSGDLVVSGNSVDVTVDGDGIKVVGVDGSVSVESNLIASNTGDSINGNGINIVNVQGSVLVTSNNVGTGNSATIAADGIHVQGATDNVTIVGNQVGNADLSPSVGGDGIQVANTTGDVSMALNVVQSATGDGIFVNVTSGAVTVKGSDINDVGGNGIRITDTTGKVTVGGDTSGLPMGNSASNTINNTGKNGILVQNTGVNPVLSTGGGGVEISNNFIGNFDNSTIGHAGTFDAIQVDDTTRGGVSVAGNVIASGHNVKVTRNAILVDTTSDTIGVAVVDNSIAGGEGDFIFKVGILVVNTKLGSVSVGGNVIAGGILATIGDDGIRVQDNGNAAINIDSNVIAGNGDSIAGDGIEALRNGGDVTISGNSIGTGTFDSFGGNGILVDTTNGGFGVVITGNQIAIGTNASVTLDAIHVTHTDHDVSVSTNVIGNSSTAIGDDGIEILNTTGSVSVGSNTVLNTTNIGIRIDDTDGSVSVKHKN